MSIEEFYFVQNPSADSFSWEGHQLNGRITLSFPWDVALKTGYTYSDKTYPGVESMGVDGLPLGLVRNDRRQPASKPGCKRISGGSRSSSLFPCRQHIDRSAVRLEEPLHHGRVRVEPAGRPEGRRMMRSTIIVLRPSRGPRRGPGGRANPGSFLQRRQGDPASRPRSGRSSSSPVTRARPRSSFFGSRSPARPRCSTSRSLRPGSSGRTSTAARR